MPLCYVELMIPTLRVDLSYPTTQTGWQSRNDLDADADVARSTARTRRARSRHSPAGWKAA